MSRLFENLSFGISAALTLVGVRRASVIYANTWPLIASGMLVLAARAISVPLVLSVQDVYPETLISLRGLREQSFLARTLRLLDRWSAKRAEAVVVISGRMERIYREDRKVSQMHLHLIPNWRDIGHHTPVSCKDSYRTQWGIRQNAFVCMFAGNVALACGIEDVIRAFSQLAEVTNVQLVIAGSGPAIEDCQKLAARISPDRVLFLGAFAPKKSSELLAAADLLILPTYGRQSLLSMPSKLISYMSSARPILAVAHPDADLSRAVRESGCGWVVEPGDITSITDKIRDAAGISPDHMAQMGVAGREYAAAHFSTDVCLPRLIDVIERAQH